MKPNKIVLTGTHLTPALALIEELKKHSYQIYYFGRNNQFDRNLITKNGGSFTSINSPKFSRYQVIFSLLTLPKLITAILTSFKLLSKIKPQVVISFGGFVALPVCLAAKILKIKLIIHEQTLKAGLTSKLTAPLADVIAVSWPQSQKYFNKTKTVLTGNPVRPQLLTVTPCQRPSQTIYITGGSQGALVINQITLETLTILLKKYSIFHQFGLAQTKDQWQQAIRIKNSLPSNLKRKYTLKQWFSVKELAQIFKQVDLIIGRSGINLVTEALLLGIPSILIPLPYTQKNEQDNNAKFLASRGLSLILPQKTLNSNTILNSIKKAYETLPKKSNQNSFSPLIISASKNLLSLLK